jgi:MSHA biogenesis protein MshG
VTIYRYRGRGGRGDLVEGAIDAPSAEAVARQLMNSGVTPVEIREELQQQDVMAALRRLRGPVTPDLSELVLLSRQLYTLTKAGVPLGQALAGLARSTRNVTLRDVLENVKATVESGRELSAALAMHPRIFSSLYINTVKIGENTGRLEDVFLRLSEYLDRERDTRSRIKAALRYPSFVLIAITIAIGVINVMVIPQFAKIFERAKVELPLPTRIIVGTSDFFVAWWPVLAVIAVGAVFAFRAWRSTPEGTYRWDGIKLRLPIVGDIIYRATLGRFARGFSMALAAGVPLAQALSVMSQAVDNEYVGERIRNIRSGIERGDSLTRTATATGMFSPLVLQMLSVGEDAGAIDALLVEVAEFYEREVDYDIKNLSQAIEPILIGVLAAFVLVFALGVFLPLWDMAQVKLRG